MPYAEIGQQLQTASSTWWPIYMASHGHFGVILELLEFREIPYTLKNTSEPSKCSVIKFLVLSTSFVSVSARLALERVREQDV